MEMQITNSNMEEPRNSAAEKEKNKLVISVGRVAAVVGSGGGIGAGLIFFGGVMATTALAFLFRRRRCRKSSNGKNCNDEDQSTASANEVPCELMEDINCNTHEEREFHCDAVNSSSRKDMDQNLRNGSSYTGVCENGCAMISDEGFFRDEKDRLELDGRSEDTGTAIVDQDVKEAHQEMLVNPEGITMDANSWKREDMGEFHFQETRDVIEPDQGMLVKMQSRDEQASSIHGGQEDQGNGSHTILLLAEVEEKWKQHESSLTARTEENELLEVADDFDNVNLISEQRQANRETTDLVDDHASIGNRQKLQQMDELGTFRNGGDQENNSAPDELTSEGRSNKNCAENGIENGFKEVEQPAEPIQGPKEKLQLPKEEQFIQKQALKYLNKVEIDGIMQNRLQKLNDDVKGSLKLSLFGRCILHLAELTHQTTNSHKRRILVFTILVLSGSLRVWYFSRPFLKILLMHLRNYLMIKLHLRFKNYLRSFGRIKIVPKMLGI